MSKIALSSNNSGTGVFTIASLGTNTNQTLTLPDASGTINVSGLANEVPAGSNTAPAIYSTGDNNTGLFFPAADTVAVTTGGTERMRIDSTGYVGIGTAVPVSPLHVYLTDATTYGDGTAALDTTNLIRVQNGSQVDDTYSGIQLASENAAGTVGWWSIASVSTSSNYDNDLVFHTRTGSTTYAERARIDASGNLLIGTTDSAPTVNNVAGFSFIPGGGSLQVNAEANLHRMGRRQDGTIIGLYSAGVLQGTINIAGTTTSYNGGHLSRWAQLPDNSRPELLKGTVMSNLDQMSNWTNETNEQLNCVQVSTIEGDPDVAGVFVAWDSQDDGYNDILLAMTGDMVIRIGAGTVVKRGDLLMSAGDGTAKPQEDDIVRGKTVAKVTSTHVSHVYEDGSYCVPCVIMAC